MKFDFRLCLHYVLLHLDVPEGSAFHSGVSVSISGQSIWSVWSEDRQIFLQVLVLLLVDYRSTDTLYS